MRKLTNEQISEIKRLRNEGKTHLELAHQFKVHLTTIQYWTDEKQRKRMIENSKKQGRKLSKEKRKERYLKQKEYHKTYVKNRYHTDEAYRKKTIERVKEWKRKK